MDNKANQRKNINKIAVLILLILILLCFLGIICYYIFFVYGDYTLGKTYEEFKDPITNEQLFSDESLSENPIDFKSLKEQNDEVYAWIEVPNTKVNYPIVQSRIDDLFYHRKTLDKKYSIAGTVYSQSCNSLDFYDPVTVLYGHNMPDDSMFGSLHNFQDSKFFNENDKFYVYTEKYILTYKIVSAFKFDNRHIMNSFDFNDPNQVRSFQEIVKNPDSLIRNVRNDVELNDYSKILVLSTCIGSRSSRFLVCGVMISDEKTK